MIGDTDRGVPSRRTRKLVERRRDQSSYGHRFQDAGYAILRAAEAPEQESYLAFWAGEERPGHPARHSHGHSHADNFTFEWSEGNLPIIMDSGKFSYHRDDWRAYFTSTRAHNTVEIDGESFRNAVLVNDADMLPHAPRLEQFVSGPGLQTLQASNRHIDFDTDHRRVLVLNPGRWLAVIDLGDGRGLARYGQWSGASRLALGLKRFIDRRFVDRYKGD